MAEGPFSLVGEQQNPPGAYRVNDRNDYYGGKVTADVKGRHFEETANGRTLIMTTLTPAAFLLSATTGNVPTIWNPAGSGKIFTPTHLTISYVSGTTVIGSLLWAMTNPAGSNIGTAAPIVTFTNVAPVNAGIGNANSKATALKWAPAVSTFTVAPTVFSATGINFGAVAPTNGGNFWDVPLNGRMILYPGAALSLVYSVTTSTALFFATITGIESPLPQYN